MKENTYHVVNNHKLTNDAHLDEKKSKIRTKKRNTLFFNPPIYGFTGANPARIHYTK